MGKKSTFIHDDFLLNNKYAKTLYHDHAANMPIIDYHNHLPPEEIAENKIFNNITEIWINGDHYKWRAMRTLGIDEKYITGNASDFEKFQKWAHTVPHTMRNPLYHWTHLELKRYFGISDALNTQSAEAIYRETSEKLNSPEFSCQNLLTKMNVEVLCTTEDPTDTLEHHRKIAKSNFKTKVGTAFRPDKAIFIGAASYNDYLDKLEDVTGITISSYNDLCEALRNRIIFFNENGCSLSDHGLEHLYAEDFTASEIKSIFKRKRSNQKISTVEVAKFQSAMLLFLSETYHEFSWVQQYHLGALRNNNSRMHQLLGPDTGWDSIGDFSQARKLSTFLNKLDSKNVLPKTIIYNLNPADNEVMAAMIGNFNDGSIKGKVQFGSAWWFLDQKDGMTQQLNALSNIGLISCFIGMLTDSRSFLSYPRHEYFRRILCNLFGTDIENGELPDDMDWIGQIIEDICYYNAKDYFNYQ
ncbi:glucuronate isomerase [Muriicola sp. Z0-33]|uniref:glucuronate isomerase n=1 Tax=Muriicola sp. Z0-33 TaxID=2816957 RepID=UPI002237B816|nr:glucuronate isomerase [Muriicola sp. Z0-33]MCW5516179.1 glucuronate isomerase [Muriicola sp. Z0-33]